MANWYYYHPSSVATMSQNHASWVRIKSPHGEYVRNTSTQRFDRNRLKIIQK